MAKRGREANLEAIYEAFPPEDIVAVLMAMKDIAINDGNVAAAKLVLDITTGKPATQQDIRVLHASQDALLRYQQVQAELGRVDTPQLEDYTVDGSRSLPQALGGFSPVPAEIHRGQEPVGGGGEGSADGVYILPRIQESSQVDVPQDRPTDETAG